MKETKTSINNSSILKTMSVLIPILSLATVILYNLGYGFSLPITFTYLFEPFFVFLLLHNYKIGNSQKTPILLGIVIGAAMVFESVYFVYFVIQGYRIYFDGQEMLYWATVVLEGIIAASYFIIVIMQFVVDDSARNDKKVNSAAAVMYILTCMVFLLQIFCYGYVLWSISPLKMMATIVQYLTTLSYITLCFAVMAHYGEQKDGIQNKVNVNKK